MSRRDEGRDEKRGDRSREKDRSYERLRDRDCLRERRRERERRSRSPKERDRRSRSPRDRFRPLSSRDRCDRHEGSRKHRRGDDRGFDRDPKLKEKDLKKESSDDFDACSADSGSAGFSRPKHNRLFDRAQKLGIVTNVPDVSAFLPTAASATQTGSDNAATAASSSFSAASLAAARAQALSNSIAAARVSVSVPLTVDGLTEGIPTMVGQAEALGSEVPSYYNPANVNTQRIAEQIKKRKMLWARPSNRDSADSGDQHDAAGSSSTRPVSSSTVQHWAKATFKGDDRGLMTAKFRKLMGLKDDDVTSAPADGSHEILEEQDKLFSQLDRQYQAARQTTHTQRGMGLGWGH